MILTKAKELSFYSQYALSTYGRESSAYGYICFLMEVTGPDTTMLKGVPHEVMIELIKKVDAGEDPITIFLDLMKPVLRYEKALKYWGLYNGTK